MRFTNYIKELQELEAIEDKVYEENPIPFVARNQHSETLDRIDAHRRHIVKIMAASLYMSCQEAGKYDLP